VRPRVDEIDELLPQTQCTRCGYNGCRPYAEAIADGSAQINQCPPGGTATIAALATLLNRAAIPLNPDNGTEGPPLLAVIDEELCIGCAKCLPPCPVDAIIGARRQMHTVISELCTGCELCVAPCPVDCINIVARTDGRQPEASLNRLRFAAHTERLTRRSRDRASLVASRKLIVAAPSGPQAACAAHGLGPAHEPP